MGWTIEVATFFAHQDESQHYYWVMTLRTWEFICKILELIQIMICTHSLRLFYANERINNVVNIFRFGIKPPKLNISLCNNNWKHFFFSQQIFLAAKLVTIRQHSATNQNCVYTNWYLHIQIVYIYTNKLCIYKPPLIL